MELKLGIGSYALAWSVGVPGYEMGRPPLDAGGLLDVAHRLGISLVQIADNISLHRFTHRALTELKQRACELGVSLEVGTRGTDPDLLLKYLEIAEMFRSPIVRTIIPDPSMDAAKEKLLQVLPAYEKAGVQLAVENHGLHTTEQLIRLFHELNSPSVGCCLDTVNSFGALEPPDKVIRELAPYTVNLHVKDFEIVRAPHQMGYVIQGTPAGAGRLDIPELLHTIRSCGRNPSAIIELWPPLTGTVEDAMMKEQEWLAQSVAYMKKQHGIEV